VVLLVLPCKAVLPEWFLMEEGGGLPMGVFAVVAKR
jgi:hypothetical protein